MYGGTRDPAAGQALIGGLSPRVRGNRHAGRPQATRRGSIPACTGEPGASGPGGPPSGVYPRVYGGTAGERRWRAVGQGLSPRVRGNPAQDGFGALARGSIPACTGEPGSRRLRKWKRKVYPRVYGGTAIGIAQRAELEGLSPRVRGNRWKKRRDGRKSGSIPACTGEPDTRRAPPGTARVYPRVYGGTTCTLTARRQSLGLSPRVRGNLSTWQLLRAEKRSIPACTGEPNSDRRPDDAHTVYPRVYGGTHVGMVWLSRHRGLSPRVRGNQSARHDTNLHAGVYPRVYGGTWASESAESRHRGLSPRVRGNPWRMDASRTGRRSIPACTGEPSAPRRTTASKAVYPRVYGGTGDRAVDTAPGPGLSPRVRGNPRSEDLRPKPDRSIPACTGEPKYGLGTSECP